MTDQNQEVSPGNKTEFIDVIMRQGRGDTNQELSDALREITKKVVATGKAGVLTLTVKVSQMKKTGQILIEDKIAMKLPQFDRPAGIAFADADGNLLRDDPMQEPLFTVHTVPAPNRPVVEVERPAEVVEVTAPATQVVEVNGSKAVVEVATGEIKE